MSTALVAALVWALVVALVLTSRQRRSQRVLVAAILVAVAQTLRIDELYFATDALVGATNWMTLVVCLVQTAGVSVLATTMRRTVRRQLGGTGHRLSALLAFVVGGMVCSFAFIDAPRSSVRFMHDFGAQPPSVLFDGTAMIYTGLVLGYAGWTLTMVLPAVSDRVFAAGIWLLVLGCVTAVGFSLVAVVTDVARLAGLDGVVQRLQNLHGLLGVASILQLCSGFILLPFARRSGASRREAEVRRMAGKVAKVWRVAAPVEVQERVGLAHEDPEMRLHRQLIEIEDALLARDCGYTPTVWERCVMTKAQARLARYAQLKNGPWLLRVHDSTPAPSRRCLTDNGGLP